AAAAPAATGIRSGANQVAKAEQTMKVMLSARGVGLSRNDVDAGRTTLLVRNRRAAAKAFLIARHTGGLDSLPHFSGLAFVPRDEIVGPVEAVSGGKQKQVRRTLRPGSYLLVMSTAELGGDLTVIAESA